MKKYIFVILILCLFLTGCWNRRELNELAIALALGIDKSEDEYVVTAQVIVPSEVSMKGGAGRSPVTLFRARGTTVQEAFRKMSIGIPRRLYPGHLRMLVISESVAKEGIGEAIDFLSRNWETRADFYVVVAKNAKTEDILNTQTPLELIPANMMFRTLQLSEKSWSATRGVTLDMLITDLVTEAKEAVLTGIQVKGDKKKASSKQNVETLTPSARIQYNGIAVFKKDKLVGWLNETESQGYNIITNQVDRTARTISCPKGGEAVIEVFRLESEVKGKVINGNPKVDVDVQVEGNIGSVECQIDLTKLETIAALEKTYEKEVKESMKQSIKTAQEQYKTDIFGFGQAIHRSNPKEWKTLKKKWDQEFVDLPVNVKVHAEIRRIGTLNNSMLDTLKE
jgi:spore germination protein KC